MAGQPLGRVILDYLYDPLVFSTLAVASGASAHYMTPLAEGDAVYVEVKSGAYSATTYSTQTWGVVQFTWDGGALRQRWQATTDWKAVGGSADFWEPVFHPALANGYLYAPGARGTLLKIDKGTGAVISRVVPDDGWDSNTYVVSPVTADPAGNLYFTVLRLTPGAAAALPATDTPATDDEWVPSVSQFYGTNVADSFLVRVGPDDSVRKVSVSGLVPGAPGSADACTTSFDGGLPWPPEPTATAPTSACGTQRVALNAAPAVASDGAILVVTRAHFNSRYAYLVALNPDLTLRWSASLRDRFDDGCGVPHAQGGQLEPNGAPEGCASGAPYGVDPTTNEPGGGQVLDDSSSSPVVAPDGTVFLGTYSSYNYSQGHLMHFDADGDYRNAYPFGWDTTPAVYVHDGTYSLVTKENRYGNMGSYCQDTTVCPPDRNAYAPDYPEAYFVTQLSPNLDVEWQLKATNDQSCAVGPAGKMVCTTDHPFSFEWCVNAPAVDVDGTVYANSEDGWLYAIQQGGAIRDRIFEQTSASESYTPVSLGPDGTVYSHNSGHLFAVGR